MSFGEHLVELRNRLFISAIFFFVASIGGFFLVNPVLKALQAPIEEIAASSGRTAELNYAQIGEAFDVNLQIAVTVGVILSSPVWLYQIWAYVVPALKRSEKRYAIGFLGAAIPLFLAGCVTAWFIFPHTVILLAGFAPAESSSIFRTKDYVDFVLKLVIAVGVGFVLPVFLVLLNFIGLLTAKSILKGWRVAVILIAVFAAIATPASDITTMLLLAAPMVVLYFAAAGVAWLHDRAVARRADRLSADIGTETA
ncbi:twin-arginine translocase subunit TatC [Glaciihabitans sp. dw_435]|uniref:twin-arginine translocase subunit TatC n=1 Tax=Glaciihabitans sp. dw_435 TaxID=2720081 RepID=UPI001BD5C442|nr:twin-arginine translocase subunit TatC [Glaciihabitans sp. dw_435]